MARSIMHQDHNKWKYLPNYRQGDLSPADTVIGNMLPPLTSMMGEGTKITESFSTIQRIRDQCATPTMDITDDTIVISQRYGKSRTPLAQVTYSLHDHSRKAEINTHQLETLYAESLRELHLDASNIPAATNFADLASVAFCHKRTSLPKKATKALSKDLRRQFPATGRHHMTVYHDGNREPVRMDMKALADATKGDSTAFLQRLPVQAAIQQQLVRVERLIQECGMRPTITATTSQKAMSDETKHLSSSIDSSTLARQQITELLDRPEFSKSDRKTLEGIKAFHHKNIAEKLPPLLASRERALTEITNQLSQGAIPVAQRPEMEELQRFHQRNVDRMKMRQEQAEGHPSPSAKKKHSWRSTDKGKGGQPAAAAHADGSSQPAADKPAADDHGPKIPENKPGLGGG